MVNFKNITKSGFTLIELLVVISIIAILSGISIFALNDARTSGRDARRKADIAQIASGFELYKADCNVYPNTKPTPPSSLQGVAPCSPTNSNYYIQSVPDDPDTTRDYFYTPRPVNCDSTGTCRQFCIWTSLENAPTTAITNCTNLCGSAPVNCGGTGCNFCVTSP